LRCLDEPRPRTERSIERGHQATTNATGDYNLANHAHEQTVKGHVKNILAKLAANDRTHAVAIGLKRGIIEL
jgi:hypothetical protein